MTESVFFIFTLRIILIPYVLSQSTSGGAPTHMCPIIGEIEFSYTNYELSLPDLPERCVDYLVGNYAIDSKNNQNLNVLKKDEDAMKSLRAAQKSVYTVVGYKKDDPWNDILDPKDPVKYNQLVCPLIQKIKDLDLNGIVLAVTDIYYNNFTEYPTKIQVFISKLKQEKPTLKVGLPVYPSDDIDDMAKKAFDYTIVNDVIDFYYVTFNTRLTCDETVINTGTQIEKSSNQNGLSFEKIANAVTQTSIDKNKIIASVRSPVLEPGDSGIYAFPYSQYCDSANANVSCKWCADDSKKLYDMGVFIKKNAHGISISALDYDDVKGICDCKKFPVANLMFDGFDGVAYSPCQKMDKK